MDQFARKQQKIDRRAAEVMAAYPTLWSQMVNEWHQPGSDDRAWLMYSANYLFRTANIRWAMDPLRLVHRLPSAPEMSACDLEDLSFVLLTHGHGDHLDLGLLHQLQVYPILWVISAPVLNLVESEFKLPRDRLIVPRAMQPFEIHGIRITPFDGLHGVHQPGTESLRGVPAMGYLIEFNGKRWLFPGDTRTYDTSQLPSFGPVDGLFAHLWLGRGGALLEDPPLLDEFCRFFVGMMPKHVILAHLDEFGRDANDFWDSGHVQKVSSWFQKNASKINLNLAYLGASIAL